MAGMLLNLLGDGVFDLLWVFGLIHSLVAISRLSLMVVKGALISAAMPGNQPQVHNIISTLGEEKLHVLSRAFRPRI
ncbi:uncharacterized protein LOC120016418 isoform X3 [Tripterygium wilfordii]|uniref:uncharacterized protein LOC120016418 isoform X3 n=1 Tax=Tripterygium wilfordii TaxID=458696 RepID=UPI0018F7F154|nr:uncharacterized protein LOC120016418 isoform X3 [Tripterygium wilfordii]